MDLKKNFKIYRRGQIIQVKFEPQVGFEIKGIHYAIVVTNKDQPYIGTLTVIPLTSKKGNHLLSIGDWMSSDIFRYLNDEMNYYRKLLDQLQEEINSNPNYDKVVFTKNVRAFQQNIDYFKKLLKKYKNVSKNSYANVFQITTIDKSRVVNPCNKLDPIDKIKAPSEVMDLIDNAIVKSFTNKNKQN